MTKAELDRFIATHLGHGSVASPIWYLGPEPAGGSDLAAIECAVAAAIREDFAHITSLRSHLYLIKETKWFDKPISPIQPYWGKIARMELVARGLSDDPTRDEVRYFQTRVMCGLLNEGPLMIETSALPAKSTSHWPYKDLGYEDLSSRRKYFDRIMIDRMIMINALVNHHKPKVLVCCGPTYQERWDMLDNFEATEVVVIPHPCSHGPTSEDWNSLGRKFREMLQVM